MTLVDLTHPMRHGLPAFPHDPKLMIVPHGTIETMRYNISQISMGSHQGTHLDAMYHFIPQGRTIDQMPLEWFYGDAYMIKIPKTKGENITADDFKKYESVINPGTRIVYETGWHKMFGAQNFFEDFPSMTLDAAKYLASRRIRMLGMDTPTPSKQYYEVHHALLARPAEVVLVEALANLDKVPAGKFKFMGFPLKFEGGDGSPIRAVAEF